MHLESVSPIRNSKVLFKPITAKILPGRITCLMGTSGIGKTSLLDSLQGKCDYVGKIKSNQNIFRVFQETDQLFPWMSVRQNMNLGAVADWDKIFTKFDLQSYLDVLPYNLSIGQRQRFTLFRALYSDRPILLCDEPISGLDSLTAQKILKEFMALVKETKKKVLWVTHNLDEAKKLGKIITLSCTQ